MTDFWGIFMIFLLTFLVISCCGYCCVKKRQGAVLSTPVIVTSATHTAPGGHTVTQMPYQPYHGASPVTATVHSAPYPQNTTVPATTYQATNLNTAPYPPNSYMAPYPMHNAPSQMPMPAQPMQPSYSPHMNPPSYDVATGAQNVPSYEKQAPYNPNYSTP